MPSSSDSFFAIISDIHANLDALDAVLADIETFPVRGTLCLGDIVGYGPEPASCVQRVMDTCAVTVIGNHEAMSFLPKKILNSDWDISIRQPLQLANRILAGLTSKRSDEEWEHYKERTIDLFRQKGLFKNEPTTTTTNL